MATVAPEIVRILEMEQAGTLPPAGAAALESLRASGVVPRPAAPAAPTRLERVGRGISDVTEGVRQGVGVVRSVATGDPTIAEGVMQETGENLARYEAGAGLGLDPYRVVGQTAALAPLMLIGPGGATGLRAAGAQLRAAPGGRAAMAAVPVPGRVGASPMASAGYGALEGAAGGGILATGPGESRLPNVGLGLLGGGVGGYLGPAVGRGVARGVDRMRAGVGRVVDALIPGSEGGAVASRVLRQAGETIGELPEAIRSDIRRQARRAMAAGVPFDEAAALRKARLDALGLEPTQAQMTRDPADWTRERNLALLGETDPYARELMERYAAQNRRLVGIGEDIAARYPEATPLAAGESLEAAVQKQAADMQQEVRGLYQAIPQAEGRADVVPVDRLREGLGRMVSDDLFDLEADLPPGVRKRLAEFTGENARPMTVDDAMKLDKAINTQLSAIKVPDTRTAALGRVKDALWRSVDELGEGDNPAASAYRTARQAARDRFQAIGAKTIKDIVEGRTTGDKLIERRVIGGTYRDIEALRDLALRSPEGTEAWAATQRATADYLMNKAAPQGADGSFSGTALNRALKQIGSEKLDLILGPETARDVRNLSQAAIDIVHRPNQAQPSSPGTAPMIINALRKLAGLGRFAMMGDVLTGGVDTLASGAEAAATRRAAAGILDPTQLTPAAIEAARGRGTAAGRALIPALPVGLLSVEAGTGTP